ncbi:MAG: bifunctional orotidine-5'-phosphate decarboxylase/orotate phosphoribosyltransferase [Leptolyngbyaceae cyanobacterium bins.59]|nr:bifunctional orotidine-5'-phosphate decarboxylase/orotate phosphoribosyltransferase [Leptolyngbyaceae cyanobacterium bins.59]
MAFLEKLETTIAHHESLLFVGLDPNPEMMPDRYRLQEDGMLTGLRNWLEWVIEQTADFVCAYKPTLGFYQALGAPGLELLQHILKCIPPQIPVILDAKHSDLNTSSLFAHLVFDTWQADAVTLSPYPGQDQVAPFLVYPGKSVFVLCCTSNPAAAALQQYPNPETPLYLRVAEEAKNWGTAEQVGLEVGTTEPEVLARIRTIAPERLILCRSIWQEGINLNAILKAGLNIEGSGLLIPVPQDWLSQDTLGDAVRSLRMEINQIRSQRMEARSACDLWISDVVATNTHPHLDLILQLYDVGCILFGEFVQASGAVFPYYIDLRKIISNPQLFHQVLNAYSEILQGLTFDRIAGIPYGSLPTATGLSLRLNYPMIFPRKEVKAHGTRRVVEGNFQPGETIVVVDDILISGNSAMEGAAKLQSVGLKVQDIVVFLDHGHGVKDRLGANGYCAHSVLTLSEITKTLYQVGRIDEQQMIAFSAL